VSAAQDRVDQSFGGGRPVAAVGPGVNAVVAFAVVVAMVVAAAVVLAVVVAVAVAVVRGDEAPFATSASPSTTQDAMVVIWTDRPAGGSIMKSFHLKHIGHPEPGPAYAESAPK